MLYGITFILSTRHPNIQFYHPLSIQVQQKFKEMELSA